MNTAGLPVPGLVIAAPRSGSGKTTVTLGLLAALTRRGLRVGACKAGPDYIDPAFHAAATGRPGVNLDSWAMTPPLLDGLAAEAGEGVDLLICEGLMGLFDGVAPGASGDGSTASLAARFGWPVVLVLDVSGQSQSAGAVAKGFATFHPDVRVAGAVLNRVGSDRHTRLAGAGLAAAGVPVFGALPRQAGLAVPERHLGLVQAEEVDGLDARLAAMADLVEAHLDLDAIVAAAGATASPRTTAPATAMTPPGQRIAIARDRAFSFVYPHVLEGWRRAGAQLLPFSPLADEVPDPDADVCWLPGGYPELHGPVLAAASRWKAGMRAFAASKPVHGECGGYMALGEGMIDADGCRHEMLGLIGLVTSFAARRLNLGYRHAVLAADGVLGRAGTAARGHEFHYASVVTAGDDAPFARASGADGTDLGAIGSRRGNVTGSFFHVVAVA